MGGDAVCQVANELFPKGFSCAGTEKAITALKDLAEKNGALQAKVLKTSGGFHTPLMKPAQDELGKVLDTMVPDMKPPKHTVYMNTSAEAGGDEVLPAGDVHCGTCGSGEAARRARGSGDKTPGLGRL